MKVVICELSSSLSSIAMADGVEEERPSRTKGRLASLATRVIGTRIADANHQRQSVITVSRI